MNKQIGLFMLRYFETSTIIYKIKYYTRFTHFEWYKIHAKYNALLGKYSLLKITKKMKRGNG